MDGYENMIEQLLEKPCWVVDLLPQRVPASRGAQFSAVEAYYLNRQNGKKLRKRFTDILLKLNCYYDFLLYRGSHGLATLNPPPEILAKRIMDAQEELLILLESEDALILIGRDDTCISFYNPSEPLLTMLVQLARAHSLFLWRA